MSVPFEEVHGMEMLLNRTYEPELSQRFRETLRLGDVFVDVGANMGYFTLLASGLVGQSGRVLAFEPAVPNVHHLSRNLDINRVSNVILLTMGLSDKTAVASLGLPPYYNNGVSNLRPGNQNGVTRYVPVALGRLDDIPDQLLPRDRIRAIKIDTEGHELQVLQGMTGLLSGESRLAIACELSPQWYSTEELLALLEGYGFTGKFFANGHWQPLTASCLPDAQCNAWFER
jgi:FkbM family methyltransferase